MTNEIVIAKGLELNIILDIHEKEFAPHIIDQYCRMIEQDKIDYYVPAVFEIPYHPKFIYASFLYGENDGDMELVHREMNLYTTDNALIDHCIDSLGEVQEYEPELINDYETAIAEDMLSVLDFYNMVYWDTMYDGFRGKTIYYLTNNPVVEIW